MDHNEPSTEMSGGEMFTILHVSSEMEATADLTAIGRLLEEVNEADPEHPDVAVAIESGWTISVSASNRMVLENVEGGSMPRHTFLHSLDARLQLLRDLATGDIAAVESRPWLIGYGPVVGNDESDQGPQ